MIGGGCECSWSRTTRGWRRPSAAACATRAWSSTWSADGLEALARIGAIEYEAVVLDVMLPGMDGVETCRRLRGARALGAGADAHGARRGRGPRARARRRRRRLHDQAVLARGADGAAARARAPRPEPSARPCSRPGRCGWIPPRARSASTASRSSCRRASSRCWRRSCAARARSSPRASCSRPPGTPATSSAPTSSRSTCATCARRSTGRSADAIETVRGAGYRLRRDGGA